MSSSGRHGPVRWDQAAIIFSFARGIASTKVCIGVFAAYCVLVFGATYRATARALRHPDAHFAAVAAFMWSFVLIGFVESTYLTLGSPLPWLMTLFAAQAWSMEVGARTLHVGSSRPEQSQASLLRGGRRAQREAGGPSRSLVKTQERAADDRS